MLRRLLVLLVQLYLTADYCDPSVPGVFFFETESYFVDSVEAKTAMPDLASPTLSGVLPVRQVRETPRLAADVIARPSERVPRYSSRSYVALVSSTAPGSSEDH